MHIFLQVIPPGMEFHHIIPHDGDIDTETEANEDGKSSDPPVWTEVRYFLCALNQHYNKTIFTDFCVCYL